MINVKDQLYNVLCTVANNVTDSYPKTWEELPTVQLTEEENRVSEWTDNKEQKSYCRFRIDVWHNRSTSNLTLQIDEAIAALGLTRSQCQDVDDPSGLKHKLIRYEVIIDNNNQTTYAPN